MRTICHLRLRSQLEPEAALAACARVSAVVEPCPDAAEVFVDLSAPGSKGLWRLLQREVTAAYPQAAMGLATSKLVARVASGQATKRPNQLCLVGPSREAAFLAELPVGCLWPAAAVHEQLRRLGLHRIGQIAAMPGSLLQQHFGSLGRDLQQWSRGIDLTPVRALYPPPAVTHRVASEQPLADTVAVAGALYQAAEAVARSLSATGRSCQQLTLLCRGASGRPYESERRLPAPLTQPAPLVRAAQRLWELLEVAEPLSELVLTASDLAPLPREQTALFVSGPASEGPGGHPSRASALADALAAVCDRFGAGALTLASALSPPRRELFMAALERTWLG